MVHCKGIDHTYKASAMKGHVLKVFFFPLHQQSEKKKNSLKKKTKPDCAVYLKAEMIGEGILLGAEVCFGPWYMQKFHKTL